LDCNAYKGLATPAEIALSPRADVEAEMLALEATGVLVAPTSVYDRIVSDLKAIRAGYPQVAGIQAMPSWAPHDLLVGMDEGGLAAVQASSYIDWKCPNELYGVKSIDVHSSFVILELKGRFFIPLLEGEYASLPHVTYAEPNSVLGDGNDVCVSLDSATYSYIFDAGSGDCEAGCINHTYWGFSTDANGMITILGSWSAKAA
jgi:hypothetical protein